MILILGYLPSIFYVRILSFAESLVEIVSLLPYAKFG
jgi:hypothetical protein